MAPQRYLLLNLHRDGANSHHEQVSKGLFEQQQGELQVLTFAFTAGALDLSLKSAKLFP